MSAETIRRALRIRVAEALERGVSRADLMADLLSVSRGAGQPGTRECADAVELAQLWDGLDAYARPPAFALDDGAPVRT